MRLRLHRAGADAAGAGARGRQRGLSARDAGRAARAARRDAARAGARLAPPPPPPAWHLDLSGEAAVDEVLAAPSRRDTSVGRVARTRGGPRAAVARWEAWVANDGLAGYAKRRNDPLDVCGSSRMSAYVNIDA